MPKKKPKIDPKDWYPNPLVKKRCQEYGIPMPSYWPMDNNCLVWRLPPMTVTLGGIVVPDDAKSPHIKGILMSMGPRAMDVLRSNGIEIGHTVVFARFAGWEAHDHTTSQSLEAAYIILKDRDIIGSDELREELATGKATYVLEGGRYNLSRKLLGGRKEKLLALAASTDSKAEAETARRLAAETNTH
jgi:co-chaperonin GroES (HSP10)